MTRRRIPFQDRFAELVRAGTKHQTIRAPRKRPIQPGDTLVFYRWTGAAYRSKTETLREGVCTETHKIEIHDCQYGFVVLLDDAPLSREEAEAVAKADGFTCIMSFLAWFDKTHGLPFEGVLIKW